MGLRFLPSHFLKVPFIAAVYCVSFLIPKTTHATHSMGADISYECLGNNDYRLRLTFYRDCAGIDAPLGVQVLIHSTICNIDTFAFLLPDSGTGNDIVPVCPSVITTCHNGNFTGIEEWVYSRIFHFPANCTDWTISYELCCRNGAITTIQAPLNQNIYIFAHLNNTISPCNSSPTFTNKPVPFVCQGQPFSFNHGAYDVDGDSLAYSVISPLSVGGSQVQYRPGYSAYAPLYSVPSMIFDPVTGDFTVTPQILEVTVMAIMVSEYRNGILIGQVERDMQLTVINCTNILPALTGINGTNNFTATICAGAPFCFDMFSSDPDTGQNVTVTWDRGVTAGGFTANGTGRPTGTFCWTPTLADASPTPHCFTATVKDNSCPLNGSQIYSYCITVVNVNVNAGTDQVVNCGALGNLNATATTTTGNVSLQWNNGVSGPTQQVGPGTYTVTATNGMCTASDVVTVTANGGPTAAFNAPSICYPGSITFNDQSNIPAGATINSWNWNFGDGSGSNQQNPSHAFTSSGTYNVCLTATSNTNCTSSVCQTVNVNAPPAPSFTTSNSCIGTPTNFNNTSALTGNNFNWDLGNGTSSTSASPSITYSTAGTYAVTLTATNSSGCTASVSQQVTIHPVPVADFTSVVTPCSNSQVVFTDASSSSVTGWNWNFGNGQFSNVQNPTVSIPPGNHSVTLHVTSTNGCTDSIVHAVNVIPAFTANAIPPRSICIGASATLTASGGSGYQWPNGQTGASITVTPNSTTTYIVNVTDANGCSDTTATQVTVNPLPSVFAGNDVNICSGTNTTLTATGATSYTWSTGATTSSISVNPSNQSTYTVTGTDINGCVNTDAVDVGVNPNLVVSLTNPVMCSGSTAVLDAGYPGAAYLWSGGQTTQTISVSSTGIYSVTVTESTGCTGSAQSNVTVNPLPNVSAGNNFSICNGQSTQLNASGSTYYLWSDGSTNASLIVAPSSTTTYSVTGTTMVGCSASASVTVTVNPVVTVTPGNFFICPGNSATLDAGNPGSAYLWSSGHTTQTISVNTAGNYSVTVTAPTGCSGSATDVVAIGTQLTNNSTSASACNGLNVTLDAGNPGSAYSWSNGSTSQTISVGNTGNYSVIVTGTDGCTISFASVVTINPNPVSSFTTLPVCDYDSTHFSNTSAIASGNIVSYNWDFGNGLTSSLQNPSNFYGGNGTYNVTLTTVSNDGCTNSFNSPVTIYPSPLATFEGDDVCLGAPTTFSETSIVSNDSLNGWNWNFGDGNLSSGKQQIHLYTTDGIFHVQLIATTVHGCMDTITHDVNVYPSPVADAGPPATFCSGTLINIGTQGQNGNMYQWFPLYGVTQPTDASTTLQLYNTTSGLIDQYYYLTVTTQFGCSKTDSVLIQVRPLPELNVIAPAPQCLNGNKFLFNATGTIDQNSVLNWDFGTHANPSISNQQIPPVVSYTAPGKYALTLNYSYAGCPGPPIVDTIVVLENPPTGFTPTLFRGCAPLTVTFNNTSQSSMNTYVWTIAGDTTSGVNPVYTFDSPGNFAVTMNVQNINGCSATPYTVPIYVYGNPTAAFTNTPNHAVMYEALIDFKNNSIGAVQYYWDFGDGKYANFYEGQHMYSDTGTFNITLIVTSQYGCKDTVDGVVTIETGFSFFVPTAFTPNDDGVNDSFQGYGTFISDYEMWIYDRWGLMIYHTIDYNLPWDGRINTMAQNDVYVYRIRVKDQRQKDHLYIGSVTLVK
jgi:gliding motility-associated-like protein